MTMAEKPFRYVKIIVLRARGLFLNNDLQKNDEALPSMVASLIESLPAVDDPRRSMEEWIAQEVAFIGYAGL